MQKELTDSIIKNMSYVDFVAHLNETNRCPGGKNSIRLLAQNTFLHKDSKVLDVGCNTGYVSFELSKIIQCSITWIDINTNMIEQSQKNNMYQNVNFLVWDGMKLDFEDNSFDLVTSGGSTVFMDDIEKWLLEYKRVCKNWGFIGDINFFYTDEIPTEIIQKINELLGIHIQPWGKDFFLNMYENIWLEKYYIFEEKTYQPTEKELYMYCENIISDSIFTQYSEEVKVCAYEKFLGYMRLFFENNKYLSYGVFIYRKQPEGFSEQVSLFWY